jgi:hypothetical protein
MVVLRSALILPQDVKMRQPPSPHLLNIPFLPPEVYFVIAQHVHAKDLPNFCLASKTLASAGRPQLFDTIVLRTSPTSWTACKSINEHAQLSRVVRTLIIDVALFRIGNSVRDWHEWTRYCQSQADHYTLVNIDATQAALYKQLAGSRHLWEAYLSRLEEEKAAIKEIAIGNIQFPNLRKFQLARGVFQGENRNGYQLRQRGEQPITAPLSEWRGDGFSCASNLSMLCRTGHQPIFGANITKWRLDGLREADFCWRQMTGSIMNPGVISFKMRNILPARIRSRFLQDLRERVCRWRDLECLDLHFHERISATNATPKSPPNLEDCFGVCELSSVDRDSPESPLTWQRLRKLSLAHLSSTPEALISLVSRHSSTLRDLRLHALYISRSSPEGKEASIQSSWQEVFRGIGASTTLEKLKLSGLFRNLGILNDDWNFCVGEFGDRVAAWIMRGEQYSQREGVLLQLRSSYGSHDQTSGDPRLPGQDEAVTSGGE